MRQDETFRGAVEQLGRRGWRWIVGVGYLWIASSLVPRPHGQVTPRLLPLEWVIVLLVLSLRMLVRRRSTSAEGLVVWALWLGTAVAAPQSLTLVAWQQGVRDNLIQWVFVSNTFAGWILTGLIWWGAFEATMVLGPFAPQMVEWLTRVMSTRIRRERSS